MRLGDPFTITNMDLQSKHGNVIVCLVKCGMKSLLPFPNFNDHNVYKPKPEVDIPCAYIQT